MVHFNNLMVYMDRKVLKVVVAVESEDDRSVCGMNCLIGDEAYEGFSPSELDSVLGEFQ